MSQIFDKKLIAPDPAFVLVETTMERRFLNKVLSLCYTAYCFPETFQLATASLYIWSFHTSRSIVVLGVLLEDYTTA